MSISFTLVLALWVSSSVAEITDELFPSFQESGNERRNQWVADQTGPLSVFGAWPFGPTYCIATDGNANIAFCGSGGGVYILHFLLPEVPPEIIGQITTRGCVRGLFYQELTNTLFIASRKNGLEVWDVGNPYEPSFLGWCDTPGEALDVSVSDNIACIADGYAGLRVIDVSNPMNPFEVGFYDSPGYSRQVVLYGGNAFLADGSSLRVISVSNPSAPSVIGTCSVKSEHGLAISNDILFTTGYLEGLSVIDISVPESPVRVGVYNTLNLMGVSVYGDYLFAARENLGLEVFNISDPVNPFPVSSCEGNDIAYETVVDGGYVYLSDCKAGLSLIDVSNPLDPVLINSFDTPGNSNTVALSGDHLYLVNEGLRILNVSDPAQPFVTACCATESTVIGISLSESIACVTQGENGLTLIDVSDEYCPSIVGNCQCLGYMYDVDMWGTNAIVVGLGGGGSGGSWIRVIDVSSPDNPIEVGYCTGLFMPFSVVVQGNFAYVADGDGGTNGGLVVFDLSNGPNPVQTGVCESIKTAQEVDVSGGYAYVIGSNSGYMYLYVVDVSDSTDPFVAASMPLPGESCGISVYGDFAYIAVSGEGVYRVDVSDPLSPYIVDMAATPGFARDIAMEDNLVFTADGSAGVQILQFPSVSTEENETAVQREEYSIEAAVSPAFSCAVFSFRVPLEARVSISLYDLSGRCVDSVVQDCCTPGTHEVFFDHLYPGVYTARLSAGEVSVSDRIVVLP